jgi:hypothetical protein
LWAQRATRLSQRKDQDTESRRTDSGHRNAAYGWANISGEADARSSHAGRHDFIADRQGAETTLRALSLGAIDYISKPKLDVSNGTIEQAEEIVAKVKMGARARVRPVGASSVPPILMPGNIFQLLATHKVVAIGTLTGGTEALKNVFSPLPAAMLVNTVRAYVLR